MEPKQCRRTLALIGVVLSGLLLIPATAFGQNQTTPNSTQANETEIIVDACPLIAREPVLKTDKATYNEGEDIIVSGEFWTGPVSGPQEVNFELGSDREAEFGDLDLEAILFVEAQPGDCGFNFKFNLKEEFAPVEDLHPAEWTLFADYEGLGVTTSFEVVKDTDPKMPKVERKLITEKYDRTLNIWDDRNKECRPLVEAAFKQLKNTTDGDYWYNYVNQYTNDIFCNSKVPIYPAAGKALAYFWNFVPSVIWLNPVSYNSYDITPDEYKDDAAKQMAVILVHEATHSKHAGQFRLHSWLPKPDVDEEHWEVAKVTVQVMVAMGYAPENMPVEEFTENYLLYAYKYYFGKEMPNNVYRELFGRDKPAGLDTADIDENVKDAIVSHIREDGRHPR